MYNNNNNNNNNTCIFLKERKIFLKDQKFNRRSVTNL